MQIAGHSKSERTQALQVLPYLYYLSSTLDGAPGSPLFALEPTPGFQIYDTDLRPFLDFGLQKPVTNASFKASQEKDEIGVVPEFEPRIYQSSTLIRGSFTKPVGSDWAPVVFVGRPRPAGFVGAGVITMVPNSEKPTFQIVIPDAALNRADELRFWIFQPKMNAFVECPVMAGYPDLSLLANRKKATVDDLKAAVNGRAAGSIDVINNAPAAPVVSTESAITIVGWGAIQAKAGLLPHKVIIRLLDDQSHCLRISEAQPRIRPDVEAFFHQKALLRSGFEGIIDLTGAPKTGYIEAVAIDDGNYLRIGNAIRIIRK